MMIEQKYNVDFSLAIRNRTGKYVIGNELLKSQADRIRRTYYWRIALAKPPGRLLARLLDLTTGLELRLRGLLGDAVVPLAKFKGPTLHLDPYTVVTSRVSSQDVALVHDVGPVTHPELFDESVRSLYDRAFRRLKQVDARLVFVSRASLNGYEAIYGRTSDMRIIYPPIRPTAAQQAGEPIEEVGHPFLLTVGSLGRRKNQRLCIEAFARSGLAARGCQYVLCGAREPGANDVEALALATPGVRLLPYVSDPQLAWLYANARGFVLMSVLEGFGMPVAEAIANGLVPLVSANSVLEEVAGHQALVAAHDNLDQIARGMIRLIDLAPEERTRRSAGLRAHVADFSRASFTKQWGEVLAK